MAVNVSRCLVSKSSRNDHDLNSNLHLKLQKYLATLAVCQQSIATRIIGCNKNYRLSSGLVSHCISLRCRSLIGLSDVHVNLLQNKTYGVHCGDELINRDFASTEIDRWLHTLHWYHLVSFVMRKGTWIDVARQHQISSQNSKESTDSRALKVQSLQSELNDQDQVIVQNRRN